MQNNVWESLLKLFYNIDICYAGEVIAAAA